MKRRDEDEAFWDDRRAVPITVDPLQLVAPLPDRRTADPPFVPAGYQPTRQFYHIWESQDDDCGTRTGEQGSRRAAVVEITVLRILSSPTLVFALC